MLLQINVCLLISLLFIKNTIFISRKANIEILTDKTFDILVKKGKSSPWLVIFTVPKCSLCNQTHDIFMNFTHYYQNEDNYLNNFNLSFGSINCFQSSWTSMRFNLLTIPQVMLIKNNFYYLLRNNITEETLESFVKSPGKGTTIPPPFTYYVILSKFFELFNQILETILVNKGIKWNQNYTITLIIIAIFLFCVFEYYFINYCCRQKKKQSIHMHTN